jgi:hypothetical protein
MATYNVDLAATFVAGRDGTNTTTEVLTGPGGLQIAIRGGGGAAGEFKSGGLVAGDILLLRGTAPLNRLVYVQTDTDVSAWSIGDQVRNNTGSGDHWTGYVVQEYDNVPQGLSSNDTIIQITSPADYDDINDNQADGIENVTKAETVGINDVLCQGIQLDGNGGTAGGGNVNIVGCGEATWTARTDVATLDGGGDATYVMDISDIDYYTVEHLRITGAINDGIDRGSGGTTDFVFIHCRFDNNGSDGFDGTNLVRGLFEQCIFENNSSNGVYQSDQTTYKMCVVRNNGGTGLLLYRYCLVDGCLIYENTADGVSFSASGNRVVNSVIDDNGDAGIEIASVGNICIYCNRITNNGDYGIRVASAGYESNRENFNVLYGNDGGGIGTDLLNILSGLKSYGGTGGLGAASDDGYVDSANDLYEVTAGKEYSARNAADEIELNWDGEPATNNSVWVTAGLAIEAPAGGGGGGAALSRVRLGM